MWERRAIDGLWPLDRSQVKRCFSYYPSFIESNRSFLIKKLHNTNARLTSCTQKPNTATTEWEVSTTSSGECVNEELASRLSVVPPLLY